jgi:molecular chaperone DnaK
MMKDVEEKKIAVTDDEKKKVTEALEKMKGLKDSEDVDAIKKASEELSTAAQVIGAKMYQTEQQNQQTSNAGATEGGAENTEKKEEGPIEGEVVDEQK